MALRATASSGRQEKWVCFDRAAQQLKHWLQRADLSDLCGGSCSLGHHRPTGAIEQVNTRKWILQPSDIPAMLTEWNRSPGSSWCFYRWSLNKRHKYSLEIGLETRIFLCPGGNNPPHHSFMANIPIKKILNIMFRSCTRWEDASSSA